MKNISYILLLLLIALSMHVSAQQEHEGIYLKKPAEQYQSWLNAKGLGQILQFYGDTLKIDSTQILYLEFRYESTDSASVAWKKLQSYYHAQFNMEVEEAIFYQTMHLYATKPANTIVYIYDDYEGGYYESCLKIAIHTDENEYVTTTKSICKSYEADIVLELPDIEGMPAAKAQKIKSNYHKDSIFNAIYTYAEQYYREKHPNSQIKRWMSKENTLRFEVWNLRKEILTEEAVPIVQKFLNWCCDETIDWAKREMLVFTIKHSENDEKTILECKIQGKFGSGFYDQINKTAYIDMEQVPRFEEYLKSYADDQLKGYKKTIKKLQR